MAYKSILYVCMYLHTLSILYREFQTDLMDFLHITALCWVPNLVVSAVTKQLIKYSSECQTKDILEQQTANELILKQALF